MWYRTLYENDSYTNLSSPARHSRVNSYPGRYSADVWPKHFCNLIDHETNDRNFVVENFINCPRKVEYESVKTPDVLQLALKPVFIINYKVTDIFTRNHVNKMASISKQAID